MQTRFTAARSRVCRVGKFRNVLPVVRSAFASIVFLCSMASNWFRDWDDDFFSRPSRSRLFQSDLWGSLDRLNEDLVSNDIFSDFASKAASLRNRVEQGRLQRNSPGIKCGARRSSRSSELSGDGVDGIASPTPSSLNSAAFHYGDSDAGRVSFPTSSCSNISDCSDKSPESICTERSNTHSAVTEALPEGGEQRKVDSAETWVERNAGGSVVGEGSTSHSVETKVLPGLVQEYSKEERNYVGGSPNSSVISMQKSEQSSSQSSSKTLTSKTSKHVSSSSSMKKSSEMIGGKPFRVPPNRSVFYDELDSSILADPIQGFDRRRTRPLDRLASLVDEVFHHDRLFQTEIDSFLRARPKRTTRNFEESNKDEGLNRYKNSNEELKRENEVLQQENCRLQQVLQEVTAVNKRWQRYNNDRRMYVQKLLATIQELQEQMNQHGEAAIQRPAAASTATSIPNNDPAMLSELERLRKQHEEHTQLLRLQIKSHKDDWEVERREKKKAVEEKETLAGEVAQLKEEVRRLQGLVAAGGDDFEARRHCNCRLQVKSPSPRFQSHPHVASQHFTPRSSYQTSFQVPYSPTEEIASSVGSKSSAYNLVEEDDSASSNHDQKYRGSVDNNCEQLSRSLFFGFPSEARLATICSFSAPNESFSPISTAGQSHADDSNEPIVCPNCQRSFPPSLHSCFPDHFEFCHTTDARNKES